MKNVSKKQTDSIIKEIKKGKENSLSKLMDIYIPYVIKIVTMISQNMLAKEDVEEIVSDVFFAVWVNRDSIDIERDISAYIAQIARNKTKNKLRDTAKSTHLTEAELELIASDDSFEDDLINKEELHKLKEIIDDFNSPEKEIVYGYYFNDLKLADLAEKLKIPISTVKSKLYRARDKIRRSI